MKRDFLERDSGLETPLVDGSGEFPVVLDEEGNVLDRDIEFFTQRGAEPPDDSYFRLTNRQWAFIRHYLTHFDHIRASKEAGYGAGEEGKHKDLQKYAAATRLLRDKRIAYWLNRLISERALYPSAILVRLSQIATADLADFLNDEMLDTLGKPMFDLRKAKELGVTHLIRKMRLNKDGGLELELHDQMRALEMLGKAMGMFKEREVKVDQYIIKVVQDDG